MEIGSALSAATTVIRNLPEDPYPPSEPTYVKRSTMVESSADPVTRIACFKFLPTVTPEQKGNRTRAFLDLYAQHTDLILGMPKGGKSLHTPLALTGVKRESGWDAGFIVTFKNDAARKAFDTEPGHDTLKKETDPLLEQVFVYDFIEEKNLGW